MKKVLALVLAFVMLGSLCAGISAASVENCSDAACAHVAAIGTTHYDTLVEAVAAVQAGETVQLLKEASGCGIIVPSNSSFTLDFGGHTYTVNQNPLAGSAGTQSQAFQLLKDSTLLFKNGAIVGDHAGIRMLIQNYSNLTLENMTLDSTRGTNAVSYVMSNNCGNMNISGSTSITAKSGAVAFDVYGGFGSYTAPTVTVNTTGTITGKVEVAKSSGNAAGLELNIENANVVGELSVDSTLADGVNLTGGSYSSDVSEFVAEDKVQIVKSNRSGFKVGDEADAQAKAENGTYYENLNDAMEENDKVFVIGQLPEGTEVTVPAGKTLVVGDQELSGGSYVANADGALVVKPTPTPTPTPSGRPNPSTGVSF